MCIRDSAFIRRFEHDAILVTGDLATTGEEIDLREAAELSLGTPKERWLTGAMRPTLQGAQLPVIVLPGNHDRFDGPTAVPPFWASGGRNFDAHFEDWRSVSAVAFTLKAPLPQTDALTVVCGDLTLIEDADADGLWGRLGQGCAYETVLARMVELSSKARSFGPTAVLWAVHFPPQFPGEDAVMRLLNAESLLKKATSVGVSHILSGHTHQPLVYKPVKFPTVEVHCAGTACSLSSPTANAFHSRSFEVTGEVIENVRYCDFVWNDLAEDFVRYN